MSVTQQPPLSPHQRCCFTTNRSQSTNLRRQLLANRHQLSFDLRCAPNTCPHGPEGPDQPLLGPGFGE